MTGRNHRTPAILWWAFLVSTCLTLTSYAGPRSKSIPVPTQFLKLGEADQAKGAEILREFRGMGMAGSYYLQFELQVRPRRGEEKILTGELWTSRNEAGPISRVAVKDGQGNEKRFLIQSGVDPKVWTWVEGDETPQSTRTKNLFEPLLPETELTLFDLQMPYLYWDKFEFEGTEKLLGRTAHAFLLYPPDAIATQQTDLGAVRAYLDTQFHALVKSEMVDHEGNAYQSMTVRDLKKVDDQWMVKTIDLRNEKTRDKTRFQVTRAAVNLDLSPQIFSLESLRDNISPPARTVSLGR